MTRAAEKARGERAIFRVFAKASGLPVRWQSIRSRPEPEPDIRCTVVGEGPVAFELGEVVTQLFAETTNQRQPLRRRFRKAYAQLPEAVRSRLEERLGGPPVVFVAFPPGTSPGRWHHAIAPLLTALAERAGDLVAGDVPVWKIQALEEILVEMIVQKASSRSASLHVMEMTEVVDQTRDLLEKKFGRPYQTSAPMELVAYYISQPPPDRDGWLEEVTSFITNNLGGSPFRRVWLFDHFSRSIPLVLPPMEH